MLNNTIEIHGFNVEKFRFFEGKFLTVIEALGLSVSQEKALKDLFKNQLWELWENARFIEDKEIGGVACGSPSKGKIN